MLIVGLFGAPELLLSSPLQHLKQPLPIVVNRVNQVNGIIDEPLFDHVVEEGLAGERRARIDLDQPALELLVEDHVEPVQVEAVRVEGDIVLRRNQTLQTDLLDLIPNLRIPVDFKVLCERLAKSRKTDLRSTVNSILLVAIVIL